MESDIRRKNWVRFGVPGTTGDLINLDFVNKILKKDDAGPIYRVIIHQGVGGTGTQGSTQSYSFGATQEDRDAAYEKLYKVLIDQGILVNLVS